MKKFTKKLITVQDYPDPKFKIVIYGSSDKSKYKLNDNVVIVNDGRVGFHEDRVIGFDQDGDVMLENCPYSNTRGGFSDDCLIYLMEFKSKLKNLPKNIIVTIKNKIKDDRDFLNNDVDKNFDRTVMYFYVAKNWSEI